MRLILALALVLPACSDDLVQDPSTSTSSTSSTGPAQTSGGTSTGPDTPTTATTTSETSTTSTTADTGTSTDTSSSSGDTSSTGDDTGPQLPGECAVAADCKLFADCCACMGVPQAEDPALCDQRCDQTLCDQIGADAATCRLGQCIVKRLDCDSSKVLCLALPPECPEGQRPGVDGDCWSGACVPGEICNVVPNCTYCPQDWMCVTRVARGPQGSTCEPIPEGCMGDPGCACAGDAVCTGDFSFCTDPGGNRLDCECVNC